MSSPRPLAQLKIMRYPIDNLVNSYHPKGSITQYFAENKNLYSGICFPNVGCLENGHNGWDIVAPWGTPIYAPCDQKVTEVKDSAGGYGKHVRAVGTYQGKTYEFTYGHLSSISCGIGDNLKEGQELGKMGNTGFVVSGATPYWKTNPYAGTHLHFGVREVSDWNPNNLTYTVMNYSNGSFGAIDPTFLFLDLMGDKEVIQKLLTLISLYNNLISLLRKK